MFILCSGPDTFHARKKARELVAAFRHKHDPTGYSTEIMPCGAMHELPLLLAKIGAPSLFALKRMIRCDGLLDTLKIAEVRQLAKRLEGDQESTIILSVEHDPPAEKILKEFVGIKLVHYHSALLTGAKFVAAVIRRANEIGVSEQLAREIARRTDGDTWLAEQELMKLAACTNAPLVEAGVNNGTIFDIADKFLRRTDGWRASIANQTGDQILPALISQTRAALRVRDKATAQLHPYMVKKLSSVYFAAGENENLLLACIQVILATRTGLTLPVEKETLLSTQRFG